MLPVLIVVMGISNYVVYQTVMEYGFDLFSLPVVYFEKIYVKTHARLSTWLFGLILGYIIHQRKTIAPIKVGNVSF